MAAADPREDERELEAFADKRAMTGDDIAAAIARTRPHCVVMQERIAALRAWAAERTVTAD